VIAGLTLVGGLSACSGDDAKEAGSTTTTVAPYVYAALGDSFSAGEGAPPYEAESGACDRSTSSWTNLLAADDEVASIDHRACGGAQIGNLLTPWTERGQDAQVPGTPDPTVTLVTVTIGGNDVGFGEIVAVCVFLDCPSPTDAAFAGKLAALSNRLTDELYPALRTAYPKAEIVHVGYPRLTPPTGDPVEGCPWLTEGDQAGAAGIVAELDSTIETSAKAARVTYVDITEALAGHELCSADPWIQGIGQPGQAHPTVDGQRAIERAVAKGLGIRLVP
jgi:lysophospholipase L1-like esterase